MNNIIREDYCSIEVCKLLKDKGFDIPCEDFYCNEGEKRSLECYDPFPYNSELSEGCYSIPTHALAIKWIRENFGLFISTQPIWYNKYSKIAHFYLIYKDPEHEVGNHEDRFGEILELSHQEVKGNYLNDEKYDKFLFEKKFAFITVEEAINTGLLYTLKNLI